MDLYELSPEKREKFIEKLTEFYRGDDNALKLAVEILFVAHLWDDLVDQDKKRTTDDITRAFTLALGEIPINPYFPAVYHMLRNSMIQWEASNDLMAGNDDDRFTAFLIRNSLMEIVHYLIFLVGGPEWAKEKSTEFWRLMGRGIQQHYQQYLKEVSHA